MLRRVMAVRPRQDAFAVRATSVHLERGNHDSLSRRKLVQCIACQAASCAVHGMSGEADATYPGALWPALKVDKGGALFSVGGAWQNDISTLCPSVAMMALQAHTIFQDTGFPIDARLQKANRQTMHKFCTDLQCCAGFTP